MLKPLVRGGWEEICSQNDQKLAFSFKVDQRCKYLMTCGYGRYESIKLMYLSAA